MAATTVGGGVPGQGTNPAECTRVRTARPSSRARSIAAAIAERAMLPVQTTRMSEDVTSSLSFLGGHPATPKHSGLAVLAVKAEPAVVYALLAAKSCQSPGTPLSRCTPRFVNSSPDPATRSVTVRDTRTSPA